MDFRSILYWSLSIIVLITCLIYPNKSTLQPNVTPLNLTSHIKVEPRFFYYINNRFQALVIGQLRIDIETTKINNPLTDYNALVINDFQFEQDTNYSLNWRVGNQIYQQLIYKSPQSITPLDFHADGKNDISDIHILIEPNTAFGNNIKLQQEASFHSIYFDRIGIHNQFTANISAWSQTTPVNFSSINGYTMVQDLHMKGLVLRVSIWLLFAVVLFLVLKINSQQMILTLFLGWIIGAFFFTNNHLKQHQQLQAAFQAESRTINQLDQDALAAAKAIKVAIKSQPLLTDGIKKFVILGQNEFFSLRLIRHLLDFNMGLSLNFKKLLSIVDNQHAFILIRRSLKYCTNFEKYDWLTEQTELVIKNETFCIMRKK